MAAEGVVPVGEGATSGRLEDPQPREPRVATLRTDVPPVESLADLEWRGARPELRGLCASLGLADLPERVSRWQ